MTSAHNMIRVDEGTTYTVPTGRVFTMTGVCWSTKTTTLQYTEILNGNNSVFVAMRDKGFPVEVPIGYSFPAGTNLHCLSVGDPKVGVILGYEEPDV